MSRDLDADRSTIPQLTCLNAVYGTVFFKIERYFVDGPHGIDCCSKKCLLPSAEKNIMGKEYCSSAAS